MVHMMKCAKVYMHHLRNMCQVVTVGRINVQIERDLEDKFRRKVYERKGLKKGNLTDAVKEAMIMWINTAPIPIKNVKQEKNNAQVKKK